MLRTLGRMQRRRLAATAAAVFMTTAAGMIAVGANLGLLHVGAPDTKVGTLSPVASPTARSVVVGPVQPTVVATTPGPVSEPVGSAVPLADAGASNDGGAGATAAPTTWVADNAPAPSSPPSSTAPALNAVRAEAGDAPNLATNPTPTRGSGDD